MINQYIENLYSVIIFLIVINLTSCSNKQDKNFSSLWILNNSSSFLKNDLTSDNEEMILFDEENIALFLDPEFGFSRRLPIETINDTFRVDGKYFEIIARSRSDVSLLNKLGDTLSYSIFTSPNTIDYSREVQYSLQFDNLTMNLGPSLDTISPFKVPMELLSGENVLDVGFINVSNKGNSKQILHSEMFVLSNVTVNDKNRYVGYIIGSSVKRDLSFNICSNENNCIFELIELQSGSYRGSEIISRDRFVKEVLENTGWEIGTRSSYKTDKVFVDNEEFFVPTVEIDSNGLITFKINDLVTDEFSQVYKSNNTRYIYLKEHERSMTILFSKNMDTISCFRTYDFATEDDRYESWSKNETFIRFD